MFYLLRSSLSTSTPDSGVCDICLLICAFERKKYSTAVSLCRNFFMYSSLILWLLVHMKEEGVLLDVKEGFSNDHISSDEIQHAFSFCML